MKESVRDPSDQIFADLVFLQFVLNLMPGLNSNLVKQTSYADCLLRAFIMRCQTECSNRTCK